MFSSKSLIVSGLTLRSLIHFEFIFVHGVRECSNFILFICGYPVVPAPFVEKTVLFPLNWHLAFFLPSKYQDQLNLRTLALFLLSVILLFVIVTLLTFAVTQSQFKFYFLREAVFEHLM